MIASWRSVSEVVTGERDREIRPFTVW